MKIHEKKSMDFRVGVDIGLLLGKMRKGEVINQLLREDAEADARELALNMSYTLFTAPHSPGELHVMGSPARKPPNPPAFDPTPRTADQNSAELEREAA